MLDLDSISKWWNRKWSNWEYDGIQNVYSSEDWNKLPHTTYEIYKRTSNDGLVQIKKVKI